MNSDLVRNLISEQFPNWKNLPIKSVVAQGWDNRTFRLGNHMLLRLPSSAEYAPKIIKEQKWLPRLAPLLPLSIPKLIAVGKPNKNYPYPWSIHDWIEGDSVAFSPLIDVENIATYLAKFITTLNNIDIADGPIPELGDFSYIGGLRFYDDEMKCAIDILKNKIDTNIVKNIWKRALQTAWNRAPVWVHGDISIGNLLVQQQGRLYAVIDFGGLSIGDPACDLVIAWKFFKGKNRELFKQSLSFDDNTWDRGKGWALWKSMIVASDLTQTNLVETLTAWPTINEIIKEYNK